MLINICKIVSKDKNEADKRQMLEEYQSTINLISSSKVKLEEDKETLTASQEALQAQVDALEVVQNEKTAQLNALSKNTADQVAYEKKLD